MKTIGMIREVYRDNTLPSIRDLISSKPQTDQMTLVSYLKRGKVVAASPGSARDILSGDKIPGELKMLSDGEYEWRSDIIYYVEKYNMKLDSEFIDKIFGEKYKECNNDIGYESIEEVKDGKR